MLEIIEKLYTKIQQIIDKIDFKTIDENRKSELRFLAQFIQEKKDQNKPILLYFICTHNSRRSQFSQIWSQVAASYYGVFASSYSGGIEITSFNERAVASLERFGFIITRTGGDNPKYVVRWDDAIEPLVMYSKMYDDVSNPSSGFAAVMTCSHADGNCPFVAGCEKRFSIRYEDPKEFDDSPLESTLYDYRSFEIATELFYVFSRIH